MESLCKQLAYTLDLLRGMKDYIVVRPELQGTSAMRSQLRQNNVTEDEVAGFGTFILNPEEFIDYTFDRVTNHGQDLNSEWVPKMAGAFHCLIVMNALKLHGMIPNLNVMNQAGIDSIDGRLVHFRGMAQRQHDPKVYRPYIRIRNTVTGAMFEKCSMFSDKLELAPGQELVEDGDLSGLKEAEFITFVSVPGESPWKLENCWNENKVYQKIMFSTQPSAALAVPPECFSGQLEDRLNPISVLAKIHRRLHQKGEIRMNDVVNLVGFVTVDKSGENNDGLTDDGINDSTPNETNKEPQLSLSVLGYWKDQLEDLDNTMLTTAFIQLKRILVDCFFGDELCAHYVLMNLLSFVSGRAEGEGTPVGNFPICITGIPESASRFLHKILQYIVPSSLYLENFLESICTESYVPRMDYEADKLVTGVLQLGNGTHLFVEEGDISEETLVNMRNNQQAKKNLAGLESLIGNQTLQYDFTYQQMDIFHDVPVIILSSAKKTMFTKVLQVPFRPVHSLEIFYSEIKPRVLYESVVDFESIDLIRRAIMKVKGRKEFKIAEEVEEEIAEDFANMRQSGAQIDADGLSSLVTHAQILTSLRASSTLTIPIWKDALQFDTEMRQRLQEKEIFCSKPTSS